MDIRLAPDIQVPSIEQLKQISNDYAHSLS